MIGSQKFRFTWFLVGISLISAALIMQSMVMTRIFSVVLWYHFSFLAISLAMFGLTFGGLLVYLLPGCFSETRLTKHMVITCVIFSCFAILALLLILNYHRIPKKMAFSTGALTLLTIGTGLPFISAGTAIALALTHYKKQVSKIYFFDLAGSGIGCLLTILALNFFGGPGAVLFIALVGSVGGACFAVHGRNKLLTGISLIVALIFFTVLMANYSTNFLKVTHVKIGKEGIHLYEKWNSFSRVMVTKLPSNTGLPESRRVIWSDGLSTEFNGFKPEQMIANLDAFAATPITRFKGNLTQVEYTRYDVSALAYYFLENPRVLIIGPGGGKEILCALVSGAKYIEAIEVNRIFEEIINDKFGSFTSRLYSYPGVKTYIDEGRSFIRRSKDKYDLIQASLIDTWAANAAGAYLLSENILYTVEAFQDYWNHLTENGILTISRYLFSQPSQTLRLISIALEVMDQQGIPTPGKHIIVVKWCPKQKPSTLNINNKPGKTKKNMVILEHIASTVLIKKNPFTDTELSLLEKLCDQLNFGIVYSNNHQNHEVFTDLIESRDRENFYKNYFYDVSPSTDNRPFFFNVLKLKDYKKAWQEYQQDFNLIAVRILVYLFILLMVLVTTAILIPLMIVPGKVLNDGNGSISMIIYFAGLGLGYMLTEMALLQRFILFLGHPIYSLAVVLFCLLFFSGVGSMLTQKLQEPARKWRWIILVAVISIQILYLIILPRVFSHFLSLPSIYRIIISTCFLVPLSILMGMPFPLGVKELTYRESTAVPWMWGINGCFSVLASVLAVIIAMNWGFSWVSITGSIAYGLSLIVTVSWVARNEPLTE